MANRMFSHDAGSLEKGLVNLFAEVTIGASGTATLVTAKSKGIASITKNGTGDYTVTLSDTYVRVVNARVTFLQKDTTTLPAAPSVSIAARTTSSVRFLTSCLDTPAATNPASGETMLIRIVASNSTAV